MNLPANSLPKVRRGFRRVAQAGLFVLFAAFFLTSCGRNEAPADLVIINDKEPETLDPALITGIAEMRIVSSVFEGLTRLDPKTAAPIPSLAEKWEISPGGRIYTFHLR